MLSLSMLFACPAPHACKSSKPIGHIGESIVSSLYWRDAARNQGNSGSPEIGNKRKLATWSLVCPPESMSQIDSEPSCNGLRLRTDSISLVRNRGSAREL